MVVRVPHLTWTSMAGEAKRDYPAAIGYQSPWYQEYRYVEDYFARLNTILTRGKTKVRIGVVHPIESYWLYWGCEEQTGRKIVFAGNTPVLLDAVPSKEVEDFVRTCIYTVFTENALLGMLQEYRIVDARDSKSMRIENIIYQLREDGKRQWLFLAHVHKMKNSDLPFCQKTRITVQGKWSVTGYDPLTENTDKIASVCEKGVTVVEQELSDHDSVLLCLEPLGAEMAEPIEAANIRQQEKQQ